MGRNNSRHQHEPGTNRLESSLAEKALGFLVDNKVTMSQQHALVAKESKQPLGAALGTALPQVEAGDPSSLLSTGEAHLG